MFLSLHLSRSVDEVHSRIQPPFAYTSPPPRTRRTSAARRITRITSKLQTDYLDALSLACSPSSLFSITHANENASPIFRPKPLYLITINPLPRQGLHVTEPAPITRNNSEKSKERYVARNSDASIDAREDITSVEERQSTNEKKPLARA